MMLAVRGPDREREGVQERNEGKLKREKGKMESIRMERVSEWKSGHL